MGTTAHPLRFHCSAARVRSFAPGIGTNRKEAVLTAYAQTKVTGLRFKKGSREEVNLFPCVFMEHNITVQQYLARILLLGNRIRSRYVVIVWIISLTWTSR